MRYRKFVRQHLIKINAILIRTFLKTFSRNMNGEEANGSCLVFAPHKDDEVLGCGGTIAKKTQNGIEVSIVYMTSGGSSHKSSYITTEELSKIRTKEAINGTRLLGVSDSNLIFLELEEGNLEAYKNLAKQKITEILFTLRPTEIFIPYRLDPHADHVFTYTVVKECLESIKINAKIIEYPIWIVRLWFWQIDGLFKINSLGKICIKSELDSKRKALAEYKSQTTQLYPDVNWAVLPAELIGNCFQKHEFFFVS